MRTPLIRTTPCAWLRRASTAFLLFASLLQLPAQPTAATGTIQGRVFNPVSREYVGNAEVRLGGTDRVVFTENDGTFSIPGVAAGPASITVTFSGYSPAIESFTVSAGQTAVREINLTSAAASAPSVKDGKVQLAAFTVSSEREGNAKAVQAQRRNMDITTSVSSDIFGDITDGNMGEFLKYLPGVDIDYVESEARGPRLGGMDGQYVGVTVDGMRTASADSNRGGGDASRATSFESILITGIESIEISRTTSAESDADSPSGTINMRTRRAFDRRGRTVGYNVSLNFNAEEFTLRQTLGPAERLRYKWRPNAQLEYSEAFLGQRLGLMFTASRANSYTEQYSFTQDYNRTRTAADQRDLVIRQLDFKDGPKMIWKDAVSLAADYKATPRLVLSLNAVYTYVEGEFWNRNFTFVAANSNANVNNGRGTVGGDGLLTLSTRRTAQNTVPVINNGGGTAALENYTRTVSPKFEYKLDSLLVDGGFNYSRAVNAYVSLERGFSQSETLSIPLDWTASRPRADSHEWSIRQTSGPDPFDLRNWTGGTRVQSANSRWITEIYLASANAKWTVPFFRSLPTVLKFGGKWTEENRKNNNYAPWNLWRYIGPGGDVLTGYNATTGLPNITASGNWANLGFIAIHPFETGTTDALTFTNSAGVTANLPRADRKRIGELFQSQPQHFVRAATVDNYYTAFIGNRRNFRQTVTAGYAQLDVNPVPRWTLRGGLRVEQTKNRFLEYDPRLRREILAAGFPVNAAGRATTIPGLEYQFFSQPRKARESDYVNAFPSVLTKYRFTPNLEFQAGFNQAISRPPVDSLTGVYNVVEDVQRVDAPNADLEPEHSKNYQARLAYYFGNRAPGQLTLQVSQNDIRNLRETFDFTASEFGEEDPDLQNYSFRTTRNSAETRRFRNLELSYNQTLGFLPELLRGTSVNLSYSRTYASQRRNGMAPHRISGRLGYAYKRFNGSLGGVFTAERPDGVYGRFREAVAQFDTSLNWRLNRRATLYVQGRNITGQPLKWFDTPTGVVEFRQRVLRQYQEYGANWNFGVKGTF
ncbi:MAG: TonB-dependent receptor [Verrucomicrobia bacterium]|nr:TonB-dependent receptor [Verrucomicrobiota bacterium]